MRRVVAITGVVASGLAVATSPQPAGAAVSATSSGTVVTVTLTGAEEIGFGCTSGVFIVVRGGDFFASSPNVTCSALTQVNVNGDAGNQDVDGSTLDAAIFTAKPKLVVSLLTGHDSVIETKQADSLDLGIGNDQLFLVRGGATNTNLEMGTGTFDEVVARGTDAVDTISVSSTSANATITNGSSGSPASTWLVKNAEYAYGFGGKGDDVLTSTSVTAASGLVSVYFEGEEGDDALSSGAKTLIGKGGSGTNSINLGAGADQVYTSSETDSITGLSDGVDDIVFDTTSLRFGGRTLTGFSNTVAATDTYSGGSADNDFTVRIRPGSNGTAVETFSLNRTGQQQIPAGFEELTTSLSGLSALTPRTLADIVAPAQDVIISGTTSGKELIDVTIPTGSWTETVGTYRAFTTASASVGNVLIPAASPFKVHGPWTDPRQGFGHRVYRDVLLRFATDVERDTVRNHLVNGTKTRAAIVQSLVDTDTYRGLDVDRVFLRYLRRAADSGGRTYWIGSIRNGKSLRQFRAQLFGSNEYFTKAGGTNAGFVVRAYEDVLGRKPDPSGQAYWTNKANNGTERGLIARQFLSSPEAKRTIVRDQFLRFLDRQPTTDEIDTWSAALDSSATGEQALVSALAASNAYYART